MLDSRPKRDWKRPPFFSSFGCVGVVEDARVAAEGAAALLGTSRTAERLPPLHKCNSILVWNAVKGNVRKS
jgi:hypothetical protein